jgi:predicted DNA-binding protein
MLYPMKYTEQILLKVTPEMHARIKEVCEEQDRSMCYIVRMCVEQVLMNSDE